jgi:hypothetical protein
MIRHKTTTLSGLGMLEALDQLDKLNHILLDVKFVASPLGGPLEFGCE